MEDNGKIDGGDPHSRKSDVVSHHITVFLQTDYIQVICHSIILCLRVAFSKATVLLEYKVGI